MCESDKGVQVDIGGQLMGEGLQLCGIFVFISFHYSLTAARFPARGGWVSSADELARITSLPRKRTFQKGYLFLSTPARLGLRVRLPENYGNSRKMRTNFYFFLPAMSSSLWCRAERQIRAEKSAKAFWEQKLVIVLFLNLLLQLSIFQ